MDRRYLRQRSGGSWFVQVAVPRDLQRRLGRKTVERALGTADLRQAQRRRHAAVAAVLEEFDRARAEPTLEGALPQIRQEELARAYAGWRDWEEWAFAAGEEISLSEAFNLMVGDEHGDPYSGDDPEPSEERRQRARQILQRHGVKPTPNAVEQTACTLLAAEIDAMDRLMGGRTLPASIETRHPHGSIRDGAATRSELRRGEPFSTTAARYVAERMRDPNAAWTEQTRHQNEVTFRLFADHVGDATLTSIRRPDVADFLETVGRLHRDYGRSPKSKGLTLDQLLERYPGPPYLTNRTINRHASALSGLWRWARRRGLVEGESPAAEQMRDAGENPWLPFTTDELRALFQGLEFEVRPNRHTLASARPWIMAAALYSGMREGEICDLDAENVKERDGVTYFDVTRAKSKAGVRLIPVHSELVRLGFLDYVAAIGNGPLFPGITPGSRGGGRGHTFAKRFPEYRRRRGVDRDRLSFHSFRKTFVRALELAGVDRDRAALVVGHERGFTFRVYNPEGVDVAALKEVVEAVRYPLLALGSERQAG